MLQWLSVEVAKYLKNGRITEVSLKEFDAKVAVEVYTREKRDAIITDRLDQDDTMSNLARVQQGLPSIELKLDEVKSNRSAVSVSGSQATFSRIDKSEIRQRNLDVEDMFADPDTVSIVSLKSEIDEWTGISKLTVLRELEDR